MSDGIQICKSLQIFLSKRMQNDFKGKEVLIVDERVV